MAIKKGTAMGNIIYNSEGIKEQLEEIEYVKTCVDDLYMNKAFYSISLQTLELTRRFNISYQEFKVRKSTRILHELLVISQNLESKLQREAM